MAGLTTAPGPGIGFRTEAGGVHGVPLRVEARLQQGIALDPRFGVSFDGILAAQLRHERAHALAAGTSGSDLDGGLVAADPVDWPLPLARCLIGGESDWHWLATTGQPVDHDGQPVPLEPDAHRLFTRLDERRAEHVAVAVPRTASGVRGRFRNRLAPVLVVPCAAVVWHVVGDPVRIRQMVEGLGTVGARRGCGEGAVTQWLVSEDSSAAPERFGHLHPDGSLGRPVPTGCADWLGISCANTGYAGLRPPMFHPSRQRLLVLPR